MPASNLYSMVCSTFHAAGCTAMHLSTAGFTGMLSLGFFLIAQYFVILLVYHEKF